MLRLSGGDLTPYALEKVGFRQITEDEPIVAKFHGGYPYEVQGFILDDSEILLRAATIADISYALAIGSSINTLSRAVFGDDFVDDENVWSQENKCTPPYLLVKLGPSSEHRCATGYVKVEGDKLVSYKCFAGAHDEIREQAKTVLPSLISALTCAFSSGNHPTRFRPLPVTLFGKTTSDCVLHDQRLEIHASGYVSTHLTSEDLRMRTENAVHLAERIDPKVSTFFQLALEERDPLKQFLYFFLSIEIATHATFATIDHGSLAAMIAAGTRLSRTLARFRDGHQSCWTTLKERFIGCGLCAWPQLSDDDIDEFLLLKKIRDNIAHGSIAIPPPPAVEKVKRLALRLHAHEVIVSPDATSLA
jgi:hypothetical protein